MLLQYGPTATTVNHTDQWTFAGTRFHCGQQVSLDDSSPLLPLERDWRSRSVAS
jgi:hypothetical protein